VFDQQIFEEAWLGPPTISPIRVSLKPGEMQLFQIVRWACCVFGVPASSAPCVQWSVEPTEFGTISADGVLVVGADAAPGQLGTVVASVSDTCFYRATVTVYTLETNPLVGSWHEQAALSCCGMSDTPTDLFNELAFEADGRFSFTWYPFEIYRDYWGVYQFDAMTKRLTMRICSGGFVPEVTDLSGSTIVRDDGAIELSNMFFGALPGPEQDRRACGYIIARHCYRG
jgi:hypothetical protein